MYAILPIAQNTAETSACVLAYVFLMLKQACRATLKVLLIRLNAPSLDKAL